MKNTYQNKKSLYESIMRDVAAIVKSHLNELSFPVVKRAQQKRELYGQENTNLYREYKRKFIFVPKDQLMIFDKFNVEINIGMQDDDIEIIIYRGKSNKNQDGLLMRGYIPLDSDAIINRTMMYTTMDKLSFDESFINEFVNSDKRFMNIFTRQDAISLSKLIYENTSINVSFRNFTTENILIPKYFLNPKLLKTNSDIKKQYYKNDLDYVYYRQ